MCSEGCTPWPARQRDKELTLSLVGLVGMWFARSVKIQRAYVTFGRRIGIWRPATAWNVRRFVSAMNFLTCTEDAANVDTSGQNSPQTTQDQDDYVAMVARRPIGGLHGRITANPMKKERSCTRCGDSYCTRNPQHCTPCWWKYVAHKKSNELDVTQGEIYKLRLDGNGRRADD